MVRLGVGCDQTVWGVMDVGNFEIPERKWSEEVTRVVGIPHAGVLRSAWMRQGTRGSNSSALATDAGSSCFEAWGSLIVDVSLVSERQGRGSSTCPFEPDLAQVGFTNSADSLRWATSYLVARRLRLDG